MFDMSTDFPSHWAPSCAQVEKEKTHEHERAFAYEHLNLLLHYIMGMKVSMEGLQPQGLEVAGHKLVELQQSLRELEARVSQLSTSTSSSSSTSSGPPVQGAAAAAAAAVASCSPEIFNARERDIFSAQTSWVCTQVAV